MMAVGAPTRRHAGLATSALVLVCSVAAALATGPRIGPVSGSVESLATASGTWLSQLAAALPFGYAFGAGMVAAVNPCGFALLPAYLALYLHDAQPARERDRLHRRLGRSVLVSGAMTVAFVLVFGVAGVLLSVASAAVSGYLPWLGLAVGVALVVAGGRMLGGGGLYTSLGERLAGRLGSRAQQRSPRGYFAYGLAYAAASLSCVLPIFLAVVAGALAAGGVWGAAVELLLYALGMGTVVSTLTIATAFAERGALSRVRCAARYVEPASAVLLLLAGGYLVYYWLTIGGLLNT